MAGRPRRSIMVSSMRAAKSSRFWKHTIYGFRRSRDESRKNSSAIRGRGWCITVHTCGADQRTFPKTVFYSCFRERDREQARAAAISDGGHIVPGVPARGVAEIVARDGVTADSSDADLTALIILVAPVAAVTEFLGKYRLHGANPSSQIGRRMAVRDALLREIQSWLDMHGANLNSTDMRAYLKQW